MNYFVKVANKSDIPIGKMRSFTVGHAPVVICNVNNEFFALADECSHDSAPISDGHLDGDSVVCPRHGATFDLHTGDVTGPPAVVGIDKYELKIEGEDILVMVP
jgi:nitrite reductase/ring-hydroxylating ferredoxin subunit